MRDVIGSHVCITVPDPQYIQACFVKLRIWKKCIESVKVEQELFGRSILHAMSICS